MKWVLDVVKVNKIMTTVTFFVSIGILNTAQSSFQSGDKMNIITLIITIVTIIVGFAAAALTMFLGITDKPVILRIRKRKVVDELTASFRNLIYLGGAVIVFSIILAIYGNVPIVLFRLNISEIMLWVFLWLTFLSLYHAYRLVHIMLNVFRQLIEEE